jgi:hypothetical protein
MSSMSSSTSCAGTAEQGELLPRDTSDATTGLIDHLAENLGDDPA